MAETLLNLLLSVYEQEAREAFFNILGQIYKVQLERRCVFGYRCSLNYEAKNPEL